MNVIDLLPAFSITPRKASAVSGEYHSGCPGCGDGGNPKTSDRFHVWPPQNNGDGSYWCRQCGKAGDIIQFLIDFQGKTYPEACAYLDREPTKRIKPVTPRVGGQGLGGQVPGAREKSDWQPKSITDPADLWQEKAEKLVAWCHEKLLSAPDQMNYLADRGLDPETVVAARLGWNPKDLWRPRESWGLETVMKGDRKKKLWLPAGLVIPCFDGDGPGKIIRLRIRRPDGCDPEKPKYYIIPGSSSIPMLRGENKEAYALVEAELDGLLMFQEAGDLIGVCALGSSANRPDSSAAAVLSGALRILDCLDYDAAGAKEQKFWSANYPQTRRWPVPDGKDPGDAYTKGVDIRSWLMAGLPPRWTVGLKGLKKGAGFQGLGAGGQVSGAGEKIEATGSGAESSAPEPDDSHPLKPLAALMRETPVEIISTSRRLSLRSKNERWKMQNWELFSRISDLVFFDEVVRRAVRDLPAGRYGERDLIKN